MDPKKAKDAGALLLLMAIASTIGGMLVAYMSIFTIVEFLIQASVLFFSGLYVGKLRWDFPSACLLGAGLGILGAVVASTSEWILYAYGIPPAAPLDAFLSYAFSASVFLCAAGLLLCPIGWSFRRKFLED